MLLGYPSKNNFKTQIPSGERRLHFYERGQEIPLIAQGIWQVNRGVLQLSKLNLQGDEILLGWVQSGGFFGQWFTALDAFQVRALSDVYLQWYSLEEIQQDSNLAQKVLLQTVNRVRQTEEILAITGFKRIEERLAQLLKLLCRYLGETKESHIRVKVRLTHQNLASAIATTRVTVTRLLGEMQKQGIVCLDNHRHLLLPLHFGD